MIQSHMTGRREAMRSELRAGIELPSDRQSHGPIESSNNHSCRSCATVVRVFAVDAFEVCVLLLLPSHPYMSLIHNFPTLSLASSISSGGTALFSPLQTFSSSLPNTGGFIPLTCHKLLLLSAISYSKLYPLFNVCGLNSSVKCAIIFA